jgi:hypothetical protein
VGAAAGTSFLQGFFGHFIDGKDVVAVNLDPFEAVGDRLLREGLGRRLSGARHGDRILIVLAEEDHGDFEDPGEVEPLVEVPFRSGAIAKVHERTRLFALELGGPGRPDRVQDLGSDGHADHKIPDALGDAIALFVAAPVHEQLQPALAAHGQCRVLAIAGEEPILGLEGVGAAHLGGLLAEQRGIGPQAPLPLQGQGALVEEAPRDHPAVEHLKIMGLEPQLDDIRRVGRAVRP